MMTWRCGCRAARWTHGDLHAANLVVCDGRLAAVIDFNDLSAGDPATDLSAGWMVLDAEHHEAFRASSVLGADDAAWARARGWALSMGVATVASSADNPRMHAMGMRTVRRALAAG